MPLLMLMLMAAPTLIMMLSTPSERHIAVIDESGLIMPALTADGTMPETIHLSATDEPLDSVMADDSFDGVLLIAPDIVDNPQKAWLYLHDAGSMELEMVFSQVIKEAVESQRLKTYNIEKLNEILDEIHADVHLQTARVSEEGESESTSSMVSFGIGMVMMFILYMFLLMYGQMVMTSIIEEKNNRVLELVVSSVKPIQLMLGKILGVGLVAVLQVFIWGVLICLMSAFVVPLLMPESLTTQVEMMNSGSLDMASSLDPDMLKAVGMFTSVSYLATLFGYILLFLIGGFLFYASIFAAIGSAVDNIQDASQLQSFAIIPIIVALVFSMSVATDPNTTAAFWFSMIPFTSPMVMLARIPFGIPHWEIWVSAAVLYVSFIIMAWISAKIYRVGIFMYGKKPTVRDLIRWARYK